MPQKNADKPTAEDRPLNAHEAPVDHYANDSRPHRRNGEAMGRQSRPQSEPSEKQAGAQKLTPEEQVTRARHVIDEERAQRKQACQTAINQALDRYNCTLYAFPTITEDGRLSASADVVALDRPPQRRR